MLDYKLIKCPKCGKSHFMKTAYSSEGLFMDIFNGYGLHDSVYRKQAEPIYKDGVLENPEAFTPEPAENYFKCVECDCNFYVKTTWKYVGGDVGYAESNEIIDKDKEDVERVAATKKRWAELEKERKKAEKKSKKAEAKNKAETFVDSLITGDNITVCDTASNLSSSTLTKAITTLGDGDKSTIDLGGVIINSDMQYTEEQIKNIEEYFGWKAKNNSED